MGEREEGEGVKDVESEKERLIGIVTEKRKIRQRKKDKQRQTHTKQTPKKCEYKKWKKTHKKGKWKGIEID